MHSSQIPKKQAADKIALTLWRQQMHTAQQQPWLASLLLQQAKHKVERFAYFYQRLTSLPRRWRRRIQRGLATGLLGASLLLSWSPAPSVHAATITVTPSASGINGSDGCSLVEAIMNANGNNRSGSTECTAGSGADTITLAGNTYSYNTAFGTDSALPNITSELTINANGATIARSGGANFRLIRVNNAGNLTLNDATITGGTAFGGILNRGMLTVNNSIISGNGSTNLNGGGISNRAAGANATTIINNSTIANNTTYGAYTFGAGIANYSIGAGNATLTINNSTISGNEIEGGFGGGISNHKTGAGTAQTTINNSTITKNTSLFIFGFPPSGGYGCLLYTSPSPRDPE